MRLTQILSALGLVSIIGLATPDTTKTIELPLQDVEQHLKSEYPKDEPRSSGFDYCSITEKSDIVSKYIAGHNVPVETFFEADSEKLSKLALEPLRDSDDYLKMLLVPVGYEDVVPKLGHLEKVLRTTFKGLNVSFSSLSESVPIGVNKVEHFPFPSNYDEVEDLKRKTNTDKLILVLNTDEHVGGNSKGYIIIADNSRTSFYIATHEVGHGLGLEDGYNRVSRESYLRGSELFISIRNLQSTVKKAYLEILPPIFDTGNHCNGKPVYSFGHPKSDIMDVNYNNQEMRSLMAKGYDFFSPFQRRIMELYIEQELAKKQ